MNWHPLESERFYRPRRLDRLRIEIEPPDNKFLVLLCYKRLGPQKGQHRSCRRIAVAMATRSVAIEIGLWRSGRNRAARDERFREGGDA